MNFNFYANILEGNKNKEPVIGDDYFLQTKEEIIKWLNKYNVKNYVINKNLTVDVNGNVDLMMKDLKKIPIKFNMVKGNFDCYSNKLTSLKGSPESVKGFYCSKNQLTSLEYCPNEIGDNLICNNNSQLTSLKGCPAIINGNFNCNENKLTSLKYFPLVKGNIYINDNPIKNLKGLKNISTILLIRLIYNYPKLDWKEIEWDKVKDLNEAVAELYKNIENNINVKESEEALRRIEELQLYQEEL